MAKENSVLLHGEALQDAMVKCRKGTDIPIRAMFYLRVIDRATQREGDPEFQYATIFIYCGRTDLFPEIMKIKKGDLVDVFGTLTTASMPKKRTCPVCGSVNVSKSDMTYISPLYVSRRESGLSPDEIDELLKQRAEVANRVWIMGNICAGLDYSDGQGTKTPALQYQLAVPRTIRVYDSTEDIETDYPWVLAKGVQAEEGKDALKIGSTVYLKGHLRSRDQSKEIQCSQCGNVFIGGDFPLIRISPHFTEYVHNCNFPEGEEHFSAEEDYDK